MFRALFARRVADYPWPSMRRPLRLVRRHVPRGTGRALDLGCGRGATAYWLARRGYRALGIDRDLWKGMPRHRRLEFQQADMLDFDYGAEEFAVVVVVNCLQAVRASQCAVVLERLLEGLAPGGLLVVAAMTQGDGYAEACLQGGGELIERNTCSDPAGTGSVFSWFDLGELRSWAIDRGLDVLHYREHRQPDAHPPLGPHEHACVSLVARKPVHSALGSDRASGSSA